MNIKKIAIGCDHGGFAYKDAIIELLVNQDIEVFDFGTDSDASVDYPDFIHPVAENVENENVELGIILCGSGNGAAMSANKHQGIRAALCWTEELAALARQHNNANIISIPARFVSKELALEMVKIFIATDFEGGRHARRVDKISCV
ncbi:MAG: ribose 5-phosphate isomerase B [Saprospiraceae bacterium]